MATDQGMDPAEGQPPFFSLGLVFFHASKQSLCHGRGFWYLCKSCGKQVVWVCSAGRGCSVLELLTLIMKLPLSHETACLHPDLPPQLS